MLAAIRFWSSDVSLTQPEGPFGRSAAAGCRWRQICSQRVDAFSLGRLRRTDVISDHVVRLSSFRSNGFIILMNEDGVFEGFTAQLLRLVNAEFAARGQFRVVVRSTSLPPVASFAWPVPHGPGLGVTRPTVVTRPSFEIFRTRCFSTSSTYTSAIGPSATPVGSVNVDTVAEPSAEPFAPEPASVETLPNGVIRRIR